MDVIGFVFLAGVVLQSSLVAHETEKHFFPIIKAALHEEMPQHSCKQWFILVTLLCAVKVPALMPLLNVSPFWACPTWAQFP